MIINHFVTLPWVPFNRGALRTATGGGGEDEDTLQPVRGRGCAVPVPAACGARPALVTGLPLVEDAELGSDPGRKSTTEGVCVSSWWQAGSARNSNRAGMGWIWVNGMTLAC